MSNITITNIDSGSVEIGNNQFEDGYLTGTSTQAFLKGTILARQTQSTTIALGTVTGTGDRAMVATAIAGRTPAVGVYTLTAGTLSSQVGTWTLAGPDAGQDTFTSAAAADTLVFEKYGIQITVVGSGGTAYTSGAYRTATVAASTTFPFVAYVKGTGSAGSETPCAVLTHAVTLAAGTARIRACISGDVNATRLIIAADGTSANVTAPVLDALRSAGITPVAVTQLGAIDNPQ